MVARWMRHLLELGTGLASPSSPELINDKRIGDPRWVPHEERIVAQKGGKSPNLVNLTSREATSWKRNSYSKSQDKKIKVDPTFFENYIRVHLDEDCDLNILSAHHWAVCV